jgi:hypothetical protein
MAVISYTVNPEASNAQVMAWTPLANGDSGTPYQTPEYPDKSVQITGTFGVAGTCLIEGSNDNTSWFPLTDFSGASLSFTAAGLRGITENTVYVRPRISSGDGTTALTVKLLARRQP